MLICEPRAQWQSRENLAISLRLINFGSRKVRSDGPRDVVTIRELSEVVRPCAATSRSFQARFEEVYVADGVFEAKSRRLNCYSSHGVGQRQENSLRARTVAKTIFGTRGCGS